MKRLLIAAILCSGAVYAEESLSTDTNAKHCVAYQKCKADHKKAKTEKKKAKKAKKEKAKADKKAHKKAKKDANRSHRQKLRQIKKDRKEAKRKHRKEHSHAVGIFKTEPKADYIARVPRDSQGNRTDYAV